MKRETWRQRFGWWLRMLGDRVSPDTGPRGMSYSFTFETGKGVVLHEGERQGCPLWYMQEDYDRAHDEADTQHPVVLWERLAEGLPRPHVEYRGGGK